MIAFVLSTWRSSSLLPGKIIVMTLNNSLNNKLLHNSCKSLVLMIQSWHLPLTWSTTLLFVFILFHLHIFLPLVFPPCLIFIVHPLFSSLQSICVCGGQCNLPKGSERCGRVPLLSVDGQCYLQERSHSGGCLQQARWTSTAPYPTMATVKPSFTLSLWDLHVPILGGCGGGGRDL